MIEQIGNAVKFVAFFVATKVGKPGLADVTVDVFNPAGAQVVTGAAATEIGGGLYAYTLGSGSVTTEGEYAAVFKTADATVDQQHLPALWVVGRAGVEDLDAAVSTRSTLTGAAAADAVWDEALAGHVSAGTAGKKLSDASTTDVLTNPVPGAYAAGSAGFALGRIGNAEFTVESPVAADGTLVLVRGDDYLVADGRAISFSSDDWPDLSDGTYYPAVTLTIRRRREAFNTGSDPVIIARRDVDASRVAGGGSQTVVFELQSADLVSPVGEEEGNTADLLPGTATGKYDVQAVLENGSVVTLATGTVNVTEDQTRVVPTLTAVPPPPPPE